MAKHLRGATKYAEESLRDIEGTKSSLADISTRLEHGTDEGPGLAQVPFTPSTLEYGGKESEETEPPANSNISKSGSTFHIPTEPRQVKASRREVVRQFWPFVLIAARTGQDHPSAGQK